MLRLPLSLMLCSLSLLAFNDADLDGVEDSLDQCPGTSFTELVDISGCTIKTLENPHHFDIIMGGSYSQISPIQEVTDTYTASLQADYYYKNFSLQASTAFYDSESSAVSSNGMTDSFIGAYYQFRPIDALSLRLGGGAILPTYASDFNNNNMDYTVSASLSYLFNNFNFFGSYSYTMINDDDFNYLEVDGVNQTNVYYQNTNAYNIGLGYYPTSKLYTSIAYNSSDSIYSKFISTSTGTTTQDSLDTVSAYLFYTIDKHWFTTASYAYGLTDTASDHYFNIRLGYYF
jgi:hypothetical protein